MSKVGLNGLPGPCGPGRTHADSFTVARVRPRTSKGTTDLLLLNLVTAVEDLCETRVNTSRTCTFHRHKKKLPVCQSLQCPGPPAWTPDPTTSCLTDIRLALIRSLERESPYGNCFVTVSHAYLSMLTVSGTCWNYRGCWHQTCPPIGTRIECFSYRD